ncbi:MAG: L-lactate dehydrogenase [Kiritimatiellae bacterium]|nr:L-lactate dehydrogenase [Kiritimatiellia bacterium]
MAMTERKVVIVGAGDVGATFAYALAQTGTASEIVLIDLRRELAEGQALDLAHGSPFMPPVAIRAGDAGDYADARVVVVTAGAKQKPGETRLDLLRRNAGIVERIADDLTAQRSEAVVVVVTNPVDILTGVALRRTGWPRERVLGSGTVLDSARFRYLLSRTCGIDVRNVHAYIVGEHGDSEVAAWSMTHIAGLPIDAFCATCGRCANWREKRAEIVEQVRKSAYHIIDYKGATCYGIGLSLVRIVGAILRDERSVLTVSTRLEGEYGLRDVCLSVPCVVGGRGIERIVAGDLARDEAEGLARSGGLLKEQLRSLAGSDDRRNPTSGL